MAYHYLPGLSEEARAAAHVWTLTTLFGDPCYRQPPHFDRECTRCSYRWRTTDVLEEVE